MVVYDYLSLNGLHFYLVWHICTRWHPIYTDYVCSWLFFLRYETTKK